MATHNTQHARADAFPSATYRRRSNETRRQHLEAQRAAHEWLWRRLLAPIPAPDPVPSGETDARQPGIASQVTGIVQGEAPSSEQKRTARRQYTPRRAAAAHLREGGRI
jgi:hypothetical protein